MQRRPRQAVENVVLGSVRDALKNATRNSIDVDVCLSTVHQMYVALAHLDVDLVRDPVLCQTP